MEVLLGHSPFAISNIDALAPKPSPVCAPTIRPRDTQGHGPSPGRGIRLRAAHRAAPTLRADGVPVGIERVPAISVINLDARTERLGLFMDEMDRLGIENVRRFDAIQDPVGAIGALVLTRASYGR